MKEYLQKLIDAGIGFEVHDSPAAILFGLQWGQSKVARILGFKRKDVIAALNWADKNPKEAIKILGL
mgnify:CR=1 FL=1